MSRTGEIRAAFRGSFGRFRLDASFAAPARGVTALFGSSGCGKTTVLRCMAGLERVADGYAAMGDEVWQDGASFRPPHRRAIGYVFQEASLFPHLSVRRNLLYGRPRTPSATTAGPGLEETVALLGLGTMLDRSPAALSGGERQRVAIGRALLSEPDLLLMDEPLSALDRETKAEVLPFLERLHDALSLPVLYVSHDMAEIERLADHLLLMEAGRVVASGPLTQLQSDPSLPLAKARDAAITLQAVVEAYDAAYGLATLSVAGGRFLVPTGALAMGEARRVRIAAADVSLACEAPRQTTVVNVLQARILEAIVSEQQPEATIVLGLGEAGHGARLLARITRRSWDLLELAVGTLVWAQVKGIALTR